MLTMSMRHTQYSVSITVHFSQVYAILTLCEWDDMNYVFLGHSLLAFVKFTHYLVYSITYVS